MKKIDENTSYEELLKQKQICMVELGALCVATSVLTTILRNPAPFIPFLGITHELTSKMKKIENTMSENDEDIKAIKIIYDEILENTIKEFKKFELNNPIETYQFFDYIFRHGYFSYDMNYYHPLKMSELKTLTMEEILFLNGHGVCRHVATFLNKIYESFEYDSNIALGHLNTIDSEKLHKFMDICKQNPTFTSEEINKKLIIEYLKPQIFTKLNYKKSGGYSNHALIRVNFESMTLLTDPATENIFYSVMNDIYQAISTSENIFLLNREITKSYYEEIKSKDIFEYEDYKLEKINSAITEGLNKAKEAKSTFDTIHKDNLPALEEAENLTRKILKKKY